MDSERLWVIFIQNTIISYGSPVGIVQKYSNIENQFILMSWEPGNNAKTNHFNDLWTWKYRRTAHFNDLVTWEYCRTSHSNDLWTWKYGKTNHFNDLGTWEYCKASHVNDRGSWKYRMESPANGVQKRKRKILRLLRNQITEGCFLSGEAFQELRLQNKCILKITSKKAGSTTVNV